MNTTAQPQAPVFFRQPPHEAIAGSHTTPTVIAHPALAAGWQGPDSHPPLPPRRLGAPTLYMPPPGSTAAARLRVRELSRQTNQSLGFWGRGWVRLTAPTLVGLAVGIPLRRRAAARAASALAPQLAELRELRSGVEQVPAAQRSKAQRKLLSKINETLALLEPRAGVVAKEIACGIAGFTVGVVVTGIVLALAVGIGLAASDGNVMTHGFFVPYGLPTFIGLQRSSSTPEIKILSGDELPLNVPLPGNYSQPQNAKDYRWV